MADNEVTVRYRSACDFDESHPMAEYDGKTKQGPWAKMCAPCFKEHGVGLGLGKGQRLVVRSAHPMEYTFEDWMRRVDTILLKKVGVTHEDGEDWTWRDEYDKGTSARAAVKIYLEEICLQEICLEGI